MLRSFSPTQIPCPHARTRPGFLSEADGRRGVDIYPMQNTSRKSDWNVQKCSLFAIISRPVSKSRGYSGASKPKRATGSDGLNHPPIRIRVALGVDQHELVVMKNNSLGLREVYLIARRTNHYFVLARCWDSPITRPISTSARLIIQNVSRCLSFNQQRCVVSFSLSPIPGEA
jgi:hypothetical protein